MPRKLHLCALIWLVLWLALSTVRQVFDIIGKLWALVLIDMIQLLAIVCGLFALCQPSSIVPCRNRLLLTALALFSALSVGHNVALLLWFCTDLLVDDHQQSDLLSFGLPFGHSFFLRHTPLCEAHFNSSVQQWEQQDDEHCPIQYSHLEGGQAVLHTLMALGTIFLLLTILFGTNHNNGTNSAECRRHAKRAERSLRKQFPFVDTDDGTVNSGTVTGASIKESHSRPACIMGPSAVVGSTCCCFEGTFSATGSIRTMAFGGDGAGSNSNTNNTATSNNNYQWQFAASGTIVPPSPLAATAVGRRSVPRPGRRAAARIGASNGHCCQPRDNGRRFGGGGGGATNLKKSAAQQHFRSTTAADGVGDGTGTPTPMETGPAVVPPFPAVPIVHERYSSLSTAGATDTVGSIHSPHQQQTHYCRAILNNNNGNNISNNNTASSTSSTSSTVYAGGYGSGGGDTCRNGMARCSNCAAANIDHHPHCKCHCANIRNHDHDRHYHHRHRQQEDDRRKLSPLYAAVELADVRAGVGNYERCRVPSAVGMAQQQQLYSSSRRASSMRTFCAPEATEDDDVGTVAGDSAVVAAHQRQRLRHENQRAAFLPLSAPMSPQYLSPCTPSYALQRGADGRRSAGAAFNGSGTSGGGGQITSLISFDPKSNTLIRVREHRRPASSSSEEAGTSGGGGNAIRERCTTKNATNAAAVNGITNDIKQRLQQRLSNNNNNTTCGTSSASSVASVPSSPAPDLPPCFGCPAAPASARFELFQPATNREHGGHNGSALSHAVNGGGIGMLNSAPATASHYFDQQQQPIGRHFSVNYQPPQHQQRQKASFYSAGDSTQHCGNSTTNPNNNNNNNNNNICALNGGTTTTETTIPSTMASSIDATANAVGTDAAASSMYEAYVGTAVPFHLRTAFPSALIGGQQQPGPVPVDTECRRRSLIDCSAASAIRLSSHFDNGTDFYESATVATIGGGADQQCKTNRHEVLAHFRRSTALPTAAGGTTTNDTMLGMFV